MGVAINGTGVTGPTLAYWLRRFGHEPVIFEKAALQTGGRLGVVSMAVGTEEQRQGVPERLYTWMHRHFPHVVDCRPIDVEHWLTSAGFTISGMQTQEIWGLPVVACVAR